MTKLQIRLSIAAIILVPALVLLYASLYTIDEAEQAIILQFGAPVGESITEPGLHMKMPFVHEIRRFDKRILSWDGDPNQIPTRGEQFISVDTTARWRIVEPLVFYQTVRDQVGATNRLNDVLDSEVRDEISSNELVEIVRSKDWQVSDEDLERAQVAGEEDEEILTKEVQSGRAELVASILEKASEQVGEFGVELVDIRIKRVDYVESVQKRVFERMIAERQRIAEKFRSEGQGEAAEIEGETEQMLAEIQSEAKREAEVIRGNADAEATKIYNEAFGADPRFYTFFRTLESYRSALGEQTTLFLDGDSDYFRYFEKLDPDVKP